MTLLHNGTQVNTITLSYVNEHSLQVGPITHLVGSKVTCMGLGNAYTRPLGYVVIWVQVDRIWGYDEDQIALVIPDFSNFATRVPVILGMPTIGHVVNIMREADMEALAMPWANARAAHLLAVHRMMPMEVGDDQEEKFDSNDNDLLMYTQKAETLEPFSDIIPVNTGKAYLGERINVMIQVLQTQNGTLPPGLTVQNTYTELRKGSKKAVAVVRNNIAYWQTLQKKTPVARVAAASPVPGHPKSEGLQEGIDKSTDFHTPKLKVRQRHGKLFDELRLKWPGFLDPGVGECSLPAPGQIPLCGLTRSSRVSALTHIMQLCRNFDTTNLPRYHTGFAPMLFQWSYSCMKHFSLQIRCNFFTA